MKIRKTTYKIGTTEGIIEQSGSVGYNFPFMVHRAQGAVFWRISHIATGFNITSKVRTIKQARAMVEKLKKFPIFLMPTVETWERAKNRMIKEQPEQYNKMIDIVYLKDEK